MTFSSPFTGPTFEIIAGPNHTSLIAHARVLEKSEKLKTVVQGEWKESIDRRIVLEDWDPETVGRLIEWLYTGDYESPFPAEVSSSNVRAIVAPVPSNPGVKAGSQSTPKFKGAKSSQRLFTPLVNICFNKADSELAPSYAKAFMQWAADSDELNIVFDFEASLLAHAKLYALADYVLLPALQAQIFYRLRDLLLFITAPSVKFPRFTCEPTSIANTPVVGNIITLVRYVYANTTKSETEEEPLRKLITNFIALIYDQFEDQGGEILRFIEQGGDCLVDVYDKVRRNEITLKNELFETK